MFIDRFHSIKFDWINKHRYRSCCTRSHACHLFASVRQLSSNSRSSRMSFLQMQRVFTVEHSLASHSYLTYQNEFRDTFPDFPVLNKSTVSRPVDRFRGTRTLHRDAPNTKKGERENVCVPERGVYFHHVIQHCFLFTDFFVFFWQVEHARSGLRDFNHSV
jgi:hypothetical protein